MRSAALLLVGGITTLCVYVDLPSVHDFVEHYAAARLLTAGQAPTIYHLEEFIQAERTFFPHMAFGVHLYYPPFSLFLLAPLALFAPQQAVLVWTIASVLAFWAGLYLLSKTYSLTERGFWLMLALVTLSGPFFQTLYLKQLASFFFLALSLILWSLKQKRIWAAVVGFVIFLLKPHLLLPLMAYIAGAGRYGNILAFAATGALALLIALVWPGINTFADFAQYCQLLKDHPEILCLERCSTMGGQLVHWFPDQAQRISTISGAVFAGMLPVLFWLGRYFRNADDWLAPALAIMPSVFFLEIFVLPYDLILLLPSLLTVLSFNTVQANKKLRYFLIASAFACYCVPMYQFAWLYPRIWLFCWMLAFHAATYAFLLVREIKAGAFAPATEHAAPETQPKTQ